MRRRLYFLFPSIEVVRTVVDELLRARIDEGHMHIMAKDGTPMQGLPEANIFQKSDLIHGMEMGLAIGGLTGFVSALIAMGFTEGGLPLGIGGIFTMTLGGALMGVWASGMIAGDIPNTQLKAFEKAIRSGEILVMVDAPKNRVDEITELVHSHHPEAGIMGVEPTMPAFP
jgi:hypothetical protein